MDATFRDLERRAQAGDPEAQERLAHRALTFTGGRHGDKIGHWVMVDGVRDHFRGKLLRVTDLGYGKAIYHIAPCYWLYSQVDTESEKKTTGTAEHPFDLMSDVVCAVSLQPEDWPQE